MASSVLISVLGKAGLGLAKEKIKSLYEGESLDKAIRFTSLQFFDEGIEVTPALERWTKSPEFKKIADRIARHDDTVTDDVVIDSFVTLGNFYLNPEYPLPISEVAKSILSRFAEQYRKFELEGTSGNEHLSNQLSDTKTDLTNKITERMFVADETLAQTIATETILEKQLLESSRLVKERQFLYAREYSIKLLEDVPSEDFKSVARLENNIGACDLQLGEVDSAREHFAKALSLEPANLKYVANAAMTDLIAENYEGARKRAEAVLVLDSRHRQAAFVLLQALSGLGQTEIAEEFIKNNGWILDDASCRLALGVVDYNLHQFDEAEKHLTRSIELDGLEPQAYKLLSMVLFHPLVRAVQNDPPLFWRRIIPQAEHLPRAISNAKKAVDLLANASSPKHLQAALVNRAQIYAASDELDLGLADCDRVLANDPHDNYALNAKGMILFQQGEPRLAIRYLEMVTDEGVRRAEIIALAQAYLQLDKTDKAIQILTEGWNKDEKDARSIEIAGAIIHAYAKDLGKHAPQITETEIFLKQFDQNVEAMIVRSHILYGLRDFNGAERLLQDAVPLATQNQTDRIHLIIAQQAYFRSDWLTAAKYYTHVVDDDAPLEIKKQYAVSLYNSGQLDRALEFTSTVRNGGEPLSVLTEIEADVLEHMDVRAALDLRLRLHQAGTDSQEAQLIRAAFLCIRQADYVRAGELIDAVDRRLLTQPHALSNAARAYAILGKSGAIELAYQALRLGFDLAEYHSDYITVFLMRDEQENRLLEREIVADETFVKLKLNTGEEKTVTISSTEGPNVARQVIQITEPLAQRLVGKAIGDVITVREGGFEPITGEILEIKSKYVAAFQESMTKFATRFPENLDLQAMSVKDNDFSLFFSQVDKRYAHVRYVMEMHASNRLPLSVVAALTGNSRILAWQGLTHTEDGNIFASEGNSGDCEGITSKKVLVLDLTAMLTCQFLSIKEILADNFKLVTAQATLDEISRELVQARLNTGKKSRTIARTADGYISYEYSEGDRASWVRYLEELTAFVRKNTEVTSPESVLTLAQEKRDELSRVLGVGPLHSMLLARERDGLLYADDLALAHFARTEFEVESVWTQSILASLSNLAVITEEQYRRYLYKIIISNYRFPSFSIEEVVWMVNDLNWKTSAELQKFLRVVLAVPDQKWAVEASAELIKAANLALNQPESRFMFVDFLVTQLLEKKKNKREIIDMLIQRVAAKLYLLPINLEEVQRSLLYWRERV